MHLTTAYSLCLCWPFFFTYRYLDVLSKGFVWLDGFSRGEGGGRWGEGRMPRKGRGHTHVLLAVVV